LHLRTVWLQSAQLKRIQRILLNATLLRGGPSVRRLKKEHKFLFTCVKESLMKSARAVCEGLASGKGAKSRECLVQFKFEQRITGVKDQQCAKDAFIQKSLKLYHNRFRQ